MPGDWEVTADDLRDVALALRYEEDGLRLRRDLGKELRQAVAPAVAQAKAGVMTLGSAGLHSKGESLRGAISRGVRASARLSGDRAGVRVTASKRGMPRGFRNAPKRVNRAAGWRHPVFGNREVWVHQVGRPGWFDDPIQARAAEYRAAVEKVVRDTADRIRRGA